MNAAATPLTRRQKIGMGVALLFLCTCGGLRSIYQMGTEAQREGTATAVAAQRETQAAAPTATTRPTRTPRPEPTDEPTAAPTEPPTEEPTATAKPRVILSPRPLLQAPVATEVPAAPPAAVVAAGVPPVDESTCPGDHPIKGNRGDNGWIYHSPGRSSYKNTKPEECFATAADAEAAGYRAPRN